jgi:hypothetical protein
VRFAQTTLVIPAYNEGDRLRAGFARLASAAQDLDVDLEDLTLLYVDDGSTDDTAAIASQLIAALPKAQVLEQPHGGKGAAILAGVAASTTPQLAFVDADFAIDPHHLPALLGALDRAPIAIGSRAVAGHVDYGSWLRTRAGRGFNRFVRLLSSVGYRDTQCGFKALRTAHAKILFHFATVRGFAFDVEFLSHAQLLGWEVAEVPVSWEDVAGSHVRLSKDSVAMVVELARARMQLRSLPALHGIAVPTGLSLAELCAAAKGSPLEHAPLIGRSNGELLVVATLLEEAQAVEQLASFGAAVGAVARDLSLVELTSLPWERISLLSEHAEPRD